LLKKLFKTIAGKPAPEKNPAGSARPSTPESRSTDQQKPESAHGKSRPSGREKSGRDRAGQGHNSHSKSPQHKADGRKPDSQKSGSRKQHEARVEIDNTPWSPEDFKVEPIPGKTRFHDLDLAPPLMRAIQALGFEYCTPIQAESLPAAMRGRDTIGQAQTGTGKSAAFLLTILNRLLTIVPDERFASEPRALIIAPTRELALQIGKDAEGLARFSGLNVVTVVGGMDYEGQRRQLRDHVVDVLVATPGRLIDFMRSQDVFLDQVEVLVLDEADRMLDMGFIPDVRRIVRATPQKDHRQTLLFSATFNFDVRILIDQWTRDPKKIEIEPEQVTTDRVDQTFYLVSEHDKFNVLERILREQKPERCIIFANRRDHTRNLCEKLNKHNYKALLLSGEVAQDKRVKTLERFRSGGSTTILVATDVAGRGIHVDGVSHVINYTLPEDPEDYVHRIGRTGRAGAMGISISLVSEDDAFALPDLEKYIGKKLTLTQP
jgi:ATP-dependent RNA helicase RhlB